MGVVHKLGRQRRAFLQAGLGAPTASVDAGRLPIARGSWFEPLRPHQNSRTPRWTTSRASSRTADRGGRGIPRRRRGPRCAAPRDIDDAGRDRPVPTGRGGASRIRKRLYAMLRHIDEPPVRRMAVFLGWYALRHQSLPGPDDLFAPVAASGTRPNLGIAFEALLGALKPGTSTIAVHDPKKGGRVTLKPSGDGEYFSVTPTAGGRAGAAGHGRCSRTSSAAAFRCTIPKAATSCVPTGSVRCMRQALRSRHGGSVPDGSRNVGRWDPRRAEAIRRVGRRRRRPSPRGARRLAEGWLHASSLTTCRKTTTPGSCTGVSTGLTRCARCSCACSTAPAADPDPRGL